MLYECGRGDSSHLSRDVACDGDVPLGPVGAIATSPASGRTALYRCATASSVLVTVDPTCAGDQVVLGYVEGEAPPSTTTITGVASLSPGTVVPAFTG